jgi:tripartite ATP-independent transporter DctP family solute receptor
LLAAAARRYYQSQVRADQQPEGSGKVEIMAASTRRGFNRAFVASAAGVLAAPAIVGRASAQEVRLVLSHHVPTAHLIHATSESFAKKVADATGGQVTIDIRPASQLFNLRTAPEALQLGTLDLCWSDLATLGNWQPQFGFVSMPFIFTGYDHVKRVLQGPLADQVSQDVLSTLNIEVLALGASGFRVFCGRKEIRTADDCQGIKLRVPEIPTWVEMARALGANPTPIPAAEIYTALQTGVVDEIEVPADFITSSKILEVSQHATRTHHIFTEVSMFASAQRMASLTPEQQKAIRDAAKETVQVEKWDANIAIQEQSWNEIASKVAAIGDPDVSSFRERTKVVTDNFVQRSGPKAKEYVDGVQAVA